MTIKRQMFSGGRPESAPWEAVFVGNGSTGDFAVVVPAGVYSICAVAVSIAASVPCRLMRGGVDLLNTASAIGVGNDGGGNGGAPGGAAPQDAGGGAGGYSGDGGQGGVAPTSSPSWNHNAGSPGNGGGGGGGASRQVNSSLVTIKPGGRGGAVGLYGAGASGAAGAAGMHPSHPAAGNPGSNLGDPLVGAGALATAGGNLRYRNNIPVTPGETLTIRLGSADVPTNGVGAGVRIIAGPGRRYPSNAGEAQPQGQITLTGSNTTFTVPANVTSLCAAAQQQSGASAPVSLVVGGATVLRAQNGARIGDGGGDGGQPGHQVANPGNFTGGGGGGGGYTGNGGKGANDSAPSPNLPDSTWGAGIGAAGTGGAGGGGDSGSRRLVWPTPPQYSSTLPSPGTGVGIAGIGVNGTPTTPGSPDPIDGNMGGGQAGQAGGALAWKNAIAVTPGQVITVNAAGGRIRIIWGPGRSYPSNAGKV